ncbi:MAG TPA: phosphate starvation-inducible protein PhoH [Lachnospiraceae bacterium]|nr:PhoH family protein [Lachnospiraceae bacterium]MDY4165278.1 PhoH family protein [Lachnospiraceae bacterium]HAP03843.1 phosphate starvation-inducible protein PhoH [Lachnospiraceae bacterium]
MADVNIEIPEKDLLNIFGEFDSHVKILEDNLGVDFILRGDQLKLSGEENNLKRAEKVFNELYELSKRGHDITDGDVHYALSLKNTQTEHPLVELDSDIICHTVSGKPVKPKTLGQKEYVDTIRKRMITFGVGPAGTGKTYLAMAIGITAFMHEEVERIILTRPAIEAGEKLGFLPGDLQSKIDPYLRPLYDALYQIMGAETFQRNMEKGSIEVAPLAYMRGRTLDNAFIILDEAQNTTPAQMKMFLTRIGFGSRAVITGDATQKDLAPGTKSGLDVALKVLRNVDEIGVVRLSGNDVVRHPLVQKIVKAYEDYEKKQSEGKYKKDRRRRP